MIALDLTLTEMEIEYWVIKYSIAFFYLFPNPPMIHPDHPPYIFECLFTKMYVLTFCLLLSAYRIRKPLS